MALPSIPKIILSLAMEEGVPVDDPSHVQIMRQEISPGLHDMVVDLARAVAKDHFYNLSQLGREPHSSTTARITCSVEEGVVFRGCSDLRMMEYFFVVHVKFSQWVERIQLCYRVFTN